MPLKVEMTGNYTGYQQMLRKARLETKEFAVQVNEETSRSFRDIGRSFVAGFTGMFAFEGLKQGLQWFVETGNQIKDISEQLGMSTDQWQKWSDAVQQAGLQTEGFARVVEALKQKRTEALTDPKARAELSQLGFSDADISGNMNTSDFVLKAFENANKGPYAKQAFDTIAGVEGVRYTRALNYLPEAQSVFSPEDLKASEKTQEALNKFSEAVDKAKLSIIDAFVSTKAFTIVKDFLLGESGAQARKDADAAERQWRADMDYQPVRAARNGVALTPDEIAAVAKAHHTIAAVDLDKAMGRKGASGAATSMAVDTSDPLYAVLQQQQRDIAVKDQARAHQELESQRDLMTIGDRRRSILSEMGPLKQQIQQHEQALSTPEGFLTDAQRNSLSGVTGLSRTIQVNELREKYKDDLSAMRIEVNRDRSELKESPLAFQADSMAKVGLYSASALRFNPLLGLQQEMNQHLRQIAINTAKPSLLPPNDPHRP